MYNTATNSIINGTAKQKISRAIEMKFYWFRDIIQQNHFHILWEEGKKNIAGYVTKHHPIWYHRTIIPMYLKATKKDIEISKDRKLGLEEGMMKLPILGEPGNWIIPLRESGIKFP